MMPKYLSAFEITICDLKRANKNFMNKTALVLANKVDSKIQVLRGQRIILDSDLAELYGVPVRQLNQQIKRNADRFPADFLFRLSSVEYQRLRSQNVISNVGRGGRRYL